MEIVSPLSLFRGSLLLSLCVSCWAQAPKPDPDVVLFTDGERLSGHLVSATATTFIFQSDMIGTVTSDWSKVKELHSSTAFTVIPKGVELKKNADTTTIPSGVLAMAEQKITVTPPSGGPKTVALADAGNVVNAQAFQNAVTRNTGFLHDWRGGIAGGASLVQATQTSRTFNAGINLVRIAPLEDWLRRRNRTTFDFATTYGRVKQPASPSVKTEIYHASAERDEYLSPSVFGFGQASLDHNFSQGLDLQQAYGGGLGWSAIHRANQSLDLKAGATFIQQQFSGRSTSQHLSGSTFEEGYRRGLRRGIQFSQLMVINPAWNNLDAVSGLLSAQVSMPVSRKMSFSVATIDNYLHNPPAGFKKNSYQVNLALSYTLR